MKKFLGKFLIFFLEITWYFLSNFWGIFVDSIGYFWDKFWQFGWCIVLKKRTAFLTIFYGNFGVFLSFFCQFCNLGNLYAFLGDISVFLRYLLTFFADVIGHFEDFILRVFWTISTKPSLTWGLGHSRILFFSYYFDL